LANFAPEGHSKKKKTCVKTKKKIASSKKSGEEDQVRVFKFPSHYSTRIYKFGKGGGGSPEHKKKSGVARQNEPGVTKRRKTAEMGWNKRQRMLGGGGTRAKGKVLYPCGGEEGKAGGVAKWIGREQVKRGRW